MGFRAKLAAAMLLSGAAALVTVTGLFYAAQRRGLRAAEEEKVRLTLDDVRVMARESQLARDPLMLIDYLRHLDEARPEIARVRARYDGRWQGPEPAPLPSGETIRSESAVVPAADGRPEVLVEVGFSRRELDRRQDAARRALQNDLLRSFALVLFLAAVLSLGLGWSMSRRLLAIEAAMGEIGGGRLDRRVPDDGRDELARLARGLNAMADRLRELDDLKRTFVASVTHELRSPLFAIESYVKELLRESPALGPDDRRRLERVEANAARLAGFVTSLLDLAKIERGQLEYRPRIADLARLAEDAAEFQRSRAEERGLTLAFAADPGIPPLRLDPDLIVQVVTNLVSNAVKFTRAGGRVEVTVRRRADGVECAVRDTGVGMAPEVVSRLFRPFERGPDPLRSGGTGLGLSIAKAIVERHGGRLEASSAPDRGSRFAFILPVSDNKSLTPERAS
ncbi:MAG: HAMP domain-containing histidine kinase [Elusimicrobia bacterium]|nr:HAMP domain-containing histidine kinase [Elusimicrobiota bacterium]